MRKERGSILTGVLCLALGNQLVGCAYVNRHFLTPAAEYARVEPLFRTESCVEYKPEWYDLYHNFLVPHECENQVDAGSIGEIKELPPKAACEKALPSTNPASLKGYEDRHAVHECVAYLIMRSDAICEVHKSYIYSNRTVMNMSLGLLAAGTGIAGGLVGGLGAANALSGSAGFLTGARSLMNEEVYRNYIAEAIIREIDENRRESLSLLNSRYLSNALIVPKGRERQTGNTTETDTGSLNQVQAGVYTSSQIKRDVLGYHHLCSFYSGLASLLSKAGQKTISSDPRSAITEQVAELATRAEKLDEKIMGIDDKNDPDRLRYESELERVTAKKEALQSVLLGLGVASPELKVRILVEIT